MPTNGLKHTLININMSASILCFAKKPDGQLVFLLGKQSRPSSGCRTKNSDTLCDFGGHVADTDGNDLAVTAAREFFEESMCAVNMNLNIHHGASMKRRTKSLAHSLTSRNYVCAIRTDRHVCFVREVVWDGKVAKTFQVLRNTFQNIRRVSKRMSWMVRRKPEGPRLHLVEKWLYFDLLKQSKWICVTISFVDSSTVSVTAMNTETKVVKTITTALPEHISVADVETYKPYLALQQTMHSMWYEMPLDQKRHPAIKCTWWRGRVNRMTVSHHFLEMQSIGWWSLPNLHRLVQYIGYSQKYTIRSCFLPTIRIVLDYLAHRQNTHKDIFCTNGLTIEKSVSFKKSLLLRDENDNLEASMVV